MAEDAEAWLTRTPLPTSLQWWSEGPMQAVVDHPDRCADGVEQFLDRREALGVTPAYLTPAYDAVVAKGARRARLLQRVRDGFVIDLELADPCLRIEASVARPLVWVKASSRVLTADAGPEQVDDFLGEAVAMAAAWGAVTGRAAVASRPYDIAGEARTDPPVPAMLHRSWRHAYVVLDIGWATWLTAGHLDRLGGAAAVRRDAPVARVDDYGGSLLLRLTASPWDYDTRYEEKAALRRYLAPVWPTLANITELAAEHSREDAFTPPSPADRYADYAGPPVRARGLGNIGIEATFRLSFNGTPDTGAVAAFERLLAQWRADSNTQWGHIADPVEVALYERYGLPNPTAKPSGHGAHSAFITDRSKNSITFDVDYGPGLDVVAATTELRRRVTAWAHAHGLTPRELGVVR